MATFFSVVGCSATADDAEAPTSEEEDFAAPAAAAATATPTRGVVDAGADDIGGFRASTPPLAGEIRVAWGNCMVS